MQCNDYYFCWDMETVAQMRNTILLVLLQLLLLALLLLVLLWIFIVSTIIRIFIGCNILKTYQSPSTGWIMMLFPFCSSGLVCKRSRHDSLDVPFWHNFGSLRSHQTSTLQIRSNQNSILLNAPNLVWTRSRNSHQLTICKRTTSWMEWSARGRQVAAFTRSL